MVLVHNIQILMGYTGKIKSRIAKTVKKYSAQEGFGSAFEMAEPRLHIIHPLS